MGIARIVVLSISMTIALVMPCGATTYAVGGTGGWETSTDFSIWVQGKSFVVGDTLIFLYSSSHNVLVVTKSDYDSCDASNALESFSNGFNTMITLSKPGNMYFICGTPGHCNGGMKMAINVQPAAASGRSPAVSPHSAPSISPASVAASPSTRVSTAPSPRAAPATSNSKPPPSQSPPATQSPSKAPATQSPVEKSAAPAISHNEGIFFGLLTGLLLICSI